VTFALPAPANLTAFTMSAAAVNLAWTDNSSNETSFRIERSTSGGMFNEIGSVGADVTAFSDTGLTAGTQYAYRVRAANVDGTSAYSNVASTVTALPAAPTSLSAGAASTTQINLAWVDNASSETGFKIERSPDGTLFSQIATLGANITAYSDSGVSAGSQYYYRVKAYNGIGDSAYTNIASSITALPAAPSGLTATAASTSQINL